ncbi:hypothetical protein ACHQM5_006280 [Ranunculus cassubicifolius]
MIFKPMIRMVMMRGGSRPRFTHSNFLRVYPKATRVNSSIVNALEKYCKKGRFCALKLRLKCVIELDVGCGVAGFGMALVGCDVISTDQVEVLPLLMRNVDRNTSRIVQSHLGSAAELDWENQDHIKAICPFDYIIGADIVYAEHLLESLETIFALSGPKTTVLLGYEIRNTIVGQLFMNKCVTWFKI